MIDFSTLLVEEKRLDEIEGTIAHLLTSHMEEISSINDLDALKRKCIKIVATSDLKDKKAAKDFISNVASARGKSALLSTLATYITGEKV